MLQDLTLFHFSDVYLVPICLLLIYLFVYLKRLKYKDTPIQKYIYPAITLRFFLVIAYGLIIQYYYGYGDTMLYYQATKDMHLAVMDNFSFFKDIYFTHDLKPSDSLTPYFMYDSFGFTHYFMFDPKNFMVPKIGLIFSLLFFKSYVCISFCITLFSFAGSWKMFKVFYDLYPHLGKKIAIATLFLPSVMFWGSGLLKDSISIGAFGFLFYSSYNIFIKKKKIFYSIVIFVINSYLIFNIKPYIALCFLPAFLVWYFMGLSRRIHDATLKTVASFLFIILASISAYFILQEVTSSDVTKQYATENLFKTVQSQQSGFGSAGSGSSFELGELNNSIGSFLTLFPAGVIASLFRPFLWEVRNPLMLFSALEAFAFIILTFSSFRKIGFVGTFRMIFSDPVTLFCFVFVILFSGLVGMTTPNFGALVRYKIPCMPFYLMMIFIVMDRSGKFSTEYVFSKRFF